MLPQFQHFSPISLSFAADLLARDEIALVIGPAPALVEAGALPFMRFAHQAAGPAALRLLAFVVHHRLPGIPARPYGGRL